MHLSSIDRIDTITPAEFRNEYLAKNKPFIIRNMSHDWAAFHKWNWDYFKGLVGNLSLPVHSVVSGAKSHMLLGDYMELIQNEKIDLNIPDINLLRYTPHLTKDFKFPFIFKGYTKRFPVLTIGGEGSTIPMHFEAGLSHTLHTQFIGRKKVLLMDDNQSPYIYQLPTTNTSAVNFNKWQFRLDTENYPAVDYAKGYECTLEHGDALFIPSGYWQHMEYLESGFALSLRVLPEGIAPKINSLYRQLGNRSLNNTLAKLAPDWWQQFKNKYAREKAHMAMEKNHGLLA